MGRCLSPVWLLATLFNTLAAAAAEESQVQLRVREQIDRFMMAPVDTLLQFHDYFDLEAFPNELRAPDRNAARKYLYSLVSALEETGLKPFYGLEDGTLLGYWHNSYNQVPILVYREPGNSGYVPSDVDLGKYFTTCLDDTTGAQDECLMDDQTPMYISCNGNDGNGGCSLMVCPIQEEEEENAGKKWCLDYDVLNYTESGQGQRMGYVPTISACIDKQGAFTQDPGEVLTESESGIIYNGNCEFTDGTEVNRILNGNFASCAEEPSGICNTTYQGAYSYMNYDPRWRPWYIDCKEAQRYRFSDPYIFFSFGTVGITYTHPIYNKDEQDREVFHGVLAVDMELGDISTFLKATFNNTNIIAAVYEDVEPHRMIGVSTDTDILRWTLKSDPTKICSEEQRNSDRFLCEATQRTISDFAETPEDDILARAHVKYFEMEINDVSSNAVDVLEDESDVTSTSYVATALAYDQSSANLKWRIVLAAPIPDDESQDITAGDKIYLAVCSIATLGIFLCLILFSSFYRRRNERAVQFADFKFTSAFIIGCALLNMTTFTLLGENTDESCLLRLWSFFMATSICVSPLFVKVYRAYALLGSSIASAMTAKSNRIYTLRTLFIPFAEMIILLIFTYADPPLATQWVKSLELSPIKEVTCKFETDSFLIVQGIFDIFLLAAGCFLAFLTRNIDPRFGDAKALLFAMYNISFTSLMLVLILLFVDISEESKYVLQAIGIFWGTVFSAAGFVIPRLMAAKRDRQKQKKKNSRMRNNLEQKRRNRLISFANDDTALHDHEDSLKILVCTANVGNAPPTLESMKAWIPDGGSTSKVITLDGSEITAESFDLIVIGMQEATWGSKKAKKGEQSVASIDIENLSHESQRDEDEISIEEAKAKEDAYLSAVEGADTVLLRKMITEILGEKYKNIAHDQRGQMRQTVWALKDVAPFIKKLKITGVNTGIGNVVANKGGIIISMIYQDTRISFLSAHLAAHEGEHYYNNRCKNVYDILKGSKTFDLCNKHSIDLALASHHMFVCGDLNFRTKFDGVDNSHDDNVRRAGELIEAKDWKSLYSFDELHKGILGGDLLVGFNTLPCDFNPTFKVNRCEGFDYKDQRTPSYTDRILFKSSPGLHENIKQLTYEPCVDFITSDHKPVRGAFSIVPNDMIRPLEIPGKYRIEFTQLECENLPIADTASSDPYILFVWDMAELQEEGRNRLSVMNRKKGFPATSFKSKTLNPKWPNKKISLVTSGQEMTFDTMLFLVVYDFDFMSDDDILGTLPLNINHLLTMKPGETTKELTFNSPLERYGKYEGRIKFKLEVSMLVG